MFRLAPAFAYESETQPVFLQDTAELFTNAELSTGWVPSGSPIAVQFAIESVGGATATMEGDAVLSWPEAFRLDYLPAVAGGLLVLDALSSSHPKTKLRHLPSPGWEPSNDAA